MTTATMIEEISDKKVLVADSSSVVAGFVRKALVEMGFLEENISTTQDGNQAFMMLDIVPFNLIISGAYLKVLNGTELFNMVRSSSTDSIKNIPFLFITTEEKEKLEKQLDGAIPDGILSKPFRNEDIQKAVEEIFGVGQGPGVEASVNEVSLVDLDPRLVSTLSECGKLALEQYMVSGEAEAPIINDCLYGDYSASISLINRELDIRITMILFFSHELACEIYENIFGTVDHQDVCGVVQEMANIVGGNLKPRLEPMLVDLFRKVHGGDDAEFPTGVSWSFDLGLPKAIMRDAHTVSVHDKAALKFVIPFRVKNDEINLLVSVQKESLFESS